jgi:hypothetical protein
MSLSKDQFGGLPPAYGTTPIPEGTVRFNHYTNPDAIPGIQKEGILRSKSEEMFSRGGTESPQVFATAGEVDRDLLHNRPVVEGYAHPHQLDIGRNAPPEHLEGRRSVITFHGSVPPEQILHVHEPWHQKAKYMTENADVHAATLAGENDFLLDDPHYGPAIQHIKSRSR